MPIPFTQYLLPDGRKRHEQIERPEEIETIAQKFIASGGWFECEMLSTGHISLTACRYTEPNEPEDIVIELVPNGPAVPEAVDRLVRAADAWRP